MAMFVTYFSLNVYVGNSLKNFFALARPVGVDSGVELGLDTTDFGWPSMHAADPAHGALPPHAPSTRCTAELVRHVWHCRYAVNAVGLPFFALRYWFGAFGQV